MSPEGAVTIVLVAIAVAAIAIYLTSVVFVLRDVDSKLTSVIDAVTEIVVQTAPVDRTVLKIAGDLADSRALLEGLLVSKLGKQGATAALGATASESGAAPQNMGPAPQAGGVKLPEQRISYSRAEAVEYDRPPEPPVPPPATAGRIHYQRTQPQIPAVPPSDE